MKLTKEERKLREKGEATIHFKITVDADKLREFGGDPPQTEYHAVWNEEDQIWNSVFELMDCEHEAETINILIGELEDEIKADQVVVSVKFDKIQ